MTTDLSDQLDSIPESARSRLLQASAERERLERVLLMLPTALGEHTPEHSVEVFARAACEVTNARVVFAAVPGVLSETIACSLDSGLQKCDVDASAIEAIRAAVDGETTYVEDAESSLSAEERFQLGAALDGVEVRSVLALPIRGREERILGAICLVHHRKRAFSERHVALAGALAAHLGHTIEVTDAVAEQTRISTALQTSLLPPLLPRVPGLDLAARYRPSGQGNLVGGDFYDIFSSASGAWNLLLGDSSGVGPEAAGLAGIVRYTARALGETSPQPAEMLRLVNRAVLRAASGGRFCTAVVATFDVDDSGVHVALASAGHPAAYVQRSSGEVEVAMDDTGTLLGVLEDAPVGEATLRLEQSDALVFFTDGVIEARDDAGEHFGEERLQRIISDSTGRSAEGIARRIELEVLDHRGAREADDIAIVVARVPVLLHQVKSSANGESLPHEEASA